jgi:predicted transcriptional regulator
LPMLGVVNIWLALFNLIPAFPMDGGRVLRALLSMKMTRAKATVIAAGIGKLLAFGFVLAGFYLNPFLIFIGLFIILGANAEEQMVKTQSMIADLTANDALMTDFISIDKNEPISSAIKLLLDGQSKNFLVTANGKPYGTINRDDIIRGIREVGEAGNIEKITNQELVYVDYTKPLADVFIEFRKQGMPLVLVTENDRVKGIIDADNVAEVIMVHMARKQVN